MKMKNFFISTNQLFLSHKLLLLISFVFLMTLKISAQSPDSASKDLIELKLSSLKPVDQLEVVLNEMIISNELVFNAIETHPYDKILFELYGVLLRDIKGTIGVTGLNAIQESYKNIMEDQILKPQFKTINPNDIMHLAIGLVETLQEIPQVETIQPK
jgi:hypothetical protein